MNISVTDVAKFLGVSVHTVHRRMSGCSLSVSNLNSTNTDQKLDVVLGNILIVFPKTGYKKMLGHLNAPGMRVQEKRVRRSFHRVDLEGVKNIASA